jgi:hypothetical protein
LSRGIDHRRSVRGQRDDPPIREIALTARQGLPAFKGAAAVAVLASTVAVGSCLPAFAADGPAAKAASKPALSPPKDGPITRVEIIARARSWVDEGVPYGGGSVWTDRNGSYRRDCSGYASMAWNLRDSYTTHTLATAGFATRIGRSALLPGDLIDDPAQHVLIFAGWTNKRALTFRYFAENHTGTHAGEYAGSFAKATLAGWPTHDYVYLRYARVVGTMPMPPVPPPPTVPPVPPPTVPPVPPLPTLPPVPSAPPTAPTNRPAPPIPSASVTATASAPTAPGPTPTTSAAASV